MVGPFFLWIMDIGNDGQLLHIHTIFYTKHMFGHIFLIVALFLLVSCYICFSVYSFRACIFLVICFSHFSFNVQYRWMPSPIATINFHGYDATLRRNIHIPWIIGMHLIRSYLNVCLSTYEDSTIFSTHTHIDWQFAIFQMKWKLAGFIHIRSVNVIWSGYCHQSNSSLPCVTLHSVVEGLLSFGFSILFIVHECALIKMSMQKTRRRGKIEAHTIKCHCNRNWSHRCYWNVDTK